MDWLIFLDEHSIPYVTGGKNTKRGELSIQCPFCGSDDPSYHMGISLTTENWGCLRNPIHRGKSKARLITAILGCSQHQAELIIKQYENPDPDDLDDLIFSLPNQELKPSEIKTPLSDFNDFKEIKHKGSTYKFWKYLKSRGFDDFEIELILLKYNLRCALTGRWKDRVIIPLFDSLKLIGWTGRVLGNPISAPRYLTSSNIVKDTVYLASELEAGETILFITEGPFDALKLDFYGQPIGARATCTFGTSFSTAQVAVLKRLSSKYLKTVILFDQDAIEPAFSLQEWLSTSVEIGCLPEGVKDPGDMTKGQVEELIRRYQR